MNELNNKIDAEVGEIINRYATKIGFRTKRDYYQAIIDIQNIITEQIRLGEMRGRRKELNTFKRRKANHLQMSKKYFDQRDYELSRLAQLKKENLKDEQDL